MASQRQSESSSGANRTSASISGDARFKNTEEGESGNKSVAILTTIAGLKKQVATDRQAYVKAKMEANAEKVRRFSTHLLALSSLRSNKTAGVLEKDMLHTKIQRAYNRFTTEVDSDQPGDSPEDFSAPILFNASGVKSIVKPVRLCTMQKIPPYTSWTFLDKNQRMTDDQSVVGRRRIYYDSDGNEALVCSDTDDDEIEEEEEKRDFSKGDDFVIRETAEEHGACRPVWKALGECFDAKTSEIEARYEVIVKGGDKIIKQEDDKPDLASAMDSFDKLFCRRCLVFDCRLHGCNQPIVYLCEKQSSEIKTGALPSQPCGPSCFHLKRLDEGAQNASFQATATIPSDISMTDVKDTSKVAKTSEEAPRKGIRDSNVNALMKLLKRKAGQLKEHSQTEYAQDDVQNKRVKTAYVKKLVAKKYAQRKWKTNKVKRQGNENLSNVKQDLKEYKEFSTSEAIPVDDSKWNTLEKDLYEKGLEMFGSDSCLIAKYTLQGYKTCCEIGELMRQLGHWKFAEETKLQDDNANADEMDNELRQRRRRGRVRKLKYTWKVGAAIRKRLIDGKEGCRQYTPCSCTTSCGKQCSCHRNGSCCEKYCGCPKSCKNRFRGCHCAKSQCSSRQCPCFAAGRECDPDVCRNCWAGCGDGTLGRPPPRHETCYECRNMKLLLKQQQKVLLARSDVAGWGAFLKTPVNKHDYLGEYTGELISHREADKRGKIYDRANSSFLFNLNDQYVLDACRKGDKLKFANHSLNPNCYAKVIMVAGDHRVGIYAKEKIAAGEELFYDYGYEDRFNISWAKKPDDNHKHDEHASGSGRAQKQA